jgi:hypothetical protein
LSRYTSLSSKSRHDFGQAQSISTGPETPHD